MTARAPVNTGDHAADPLLSRQEQQPVDPFIRLLPPHAPPAPHVPMAHAPHAAYLADPTVRLERCALIERLLAGESDAAATDTGLGLPLGMTTLCIEEHATAVADAFGSVAFVAGLAWAAHEAHQAGAIALAARLRQQVALARHATRHLTALSVFR